MPLFSFGGRGSRRTNTHGAPVVRLSRCSQLQLENKDPSMAVFKSEPLFSCAGRRTWLLEGFTPAARRSQAQTTVRERGGHEKRGRPRARSDAFVISASHGAGSVSH